MISTVVLTHNDEKIIERCLESVSWCDEVVVIDDDSTDKTIEVAKEFGANVFQRKLNDDFAAQRNFGLAKARGPVRNASHSDAGGEWVLFVDSDEVISEDLRKEIEQILDTRASRGNDKEKSGNVGYYIKRKDYWGGKWLAHGETGNVKLLRLARKNAEKWVQPVHEVWEVKGAVGELVYPLLHYPHQNVAQFLEEINHYSSVYARFLHSQGVKEPAWQIVGKPVSKFFVNYVWRLGILDGTAGMVAAIMMSFHSFLVRVKLWKL